MDKPALSAKAVFDRAHEISDAEERRAYLDAACADNAELRRQVEALRQANDESGDGLDKPVTKLEASSGVAAVGTSWGAVRDGGVETRDGKVFGSGEHAQAPRLPAETPASHSHQRLSVRHF